MRALSTPGRIVSTSPSITEMIFALGAGGRLVGVTNYCTYPPEAGQIQSIGGIVDPSIETVISLQPDLVVLGSLNAMVKNKLASLKLPLLVLPEYTTEDILANLMLLAQRLGIPERGAALAAQLQEQMQALKGHADSRPGRSVMFVVGRTPGTVNDVYVVGNRVFLNDLITMAGGKNVFGDLEKQYAKVSKEEILARAPEFILESTHGRTLTDAEEREMRKVWSALSYLPAVREQRIHFLNDDYLLIPGPRFVQTLQKLTTILQSQEGAGDG